MINLLAQCYCSAGHSSSFRERGIDQAKTASVVHLHVVSQQETIKKNFHGIHYVFFSSTLCALCIFTKWECLSMTKKQKQLVNKTIYLQMLTHLPVCRLAFTLMSCGLMQSAVFSVYHQYILSSTFLLSGSHQGNAPRTSTALLMSIKCNWLSTLMQRKGAWN